MYGDSGTAGAFAGAQGILVVLIAVAIGGTVGLYALGLPIELVWVAFLPLLFGGGALAWPLFKQVQLRHDRNPE
jgi:hypothetical protein